MKKALSIILAILMIVTTIPFAFAADETPDFSDAKVLTSVDGKLYIDGVEAKTNSSKTEYRFSEGKYILGGDIETNKCIWILGAVTIDLSGYVWNLSEQRIIADMPLSVYDTSEAETGKITSNYSGQTIYNQKDGVFSLYGGTIESTSNSPVIKAVTANLYAGKIKGNSYAISCNLGDDVTINIDDTVLEISEKKADFYVHFASYDRAIGFIDVTDYKGDSLTARVDLYNTIGKITVFKGIKNAQDAEKYQITDVVCDEYFGMLYEKTEYDEATGEKSIYIVNKSFIQQPTVDNNYTVDFNYPATFQWYEVEGENIGTFEVNDLGELFTYDFKAGDMLKISGDSAFNYVDLKIGYEILMMENGYSSAFLQFNEDKTETIVVDWFQDANPVELEFTVFTEALLDGETEKTLQNAECGKSYYCKATVGEKVYLSESVDVGHSLVQVDAKAPTCTEIGWDAYESCTECDYTTYEVLLADPDAHNFEDGKCECGYVCTHETYSEGVCVDCGKVIYTYDEATDTYTVYTFAALKAALTAGGNIILGADITRENTKDITAVPENITAVLDLNGKTITSAPAVPGVNYEIICVNGNLTIKDSDTNGTITANSVISCIYVEGGNLTIEAGNFICDPDLSFAVDVYSGNAVINGGTFTNLNVLDEGKAVINGGEFQNYISTSGSLIINGGTFYGEEYTFGTFGGNWVFDIYGGEFHEDPSEYVANGYEAVANENGTWTVVCIHTDRLVQVDAKAPTCTEIGWDAYEYCTACTYTTYVEIPVDTDAHTPLEAVTENEVAPKCGVAGSYDLVVYCDDCGAELDRETKTVDALTHTDADGDYLCDNGCGYEYEKPAPEEPTPDTPDEPDTPNEPDTPDEPANDNCDHICHKSGFMGFLWKIVQLFSKLFKINPTCECGAAHY